MFLAFPHNSFAATTRPYNRPYDDPLSAMAGVSVVTDATRQTDLIGWVSCRAADGREGWVPQSWLGDADGRALLRDFSAH